MRIAIPAVVGMIQAQAAQALSDLGLTVGPMVFSRSRYYGAGRVVAELPAAGTRVSEGSEVVITIGA